MNIIASNIQSLQKDFKIDSVSLDTSRTVDVSQDDMQQILQGEGIKLQDDAKYMLLIENANKTAGAPSGYQIVKSLPPVILCEREDTETTPEKKAKVVAEGDEMENEKKRKREENEPSEHKKTPRLQRRKKDNAGEGDFEEEEAPSPSKSGAVVENVKTLEGGLKDVLHGESGISQTSGGDKDKEKIATSTKVKISPEKVEIKHKEKLKSKKEGEQEEENADAVTEAH